ncbi:hypothetical protein GVAV_003585 [Gurleya vavrai]
MFNSSNIVSDSDINRQYSNDTPISQYVIHNTNTTFSTNSYFSKFNDIEKGYANLAMMLFSSFHFLLEFIIVFYFISHDKSKIFKDLCSAFFIIYKMLDVLIFVLLIFIPIVNAPTFYYYSIVRISLSFGYYGFILICFFVVLANVGR